jgi:hypothetical protein
MMKSSAAVVIASRAIVSMFAPVEGAREAGSPLRAPSVYDFGGHCAPGSTLTKL